jgi:hypothetical protein
MSAGAAISRSTGAARIATLLILVLTAALTCALGASASASAAGTIAWSIRGVAEPTVMSNNDELVCKTELKCDRYQLLVTNVGDADASSGTITLIDHLPEGITTIGSPEGGEGPEGGLWACTEGAGKTVVTCTFSEPVPRGGYVPFLDIPVSAPTPAMSGPMTNQASVDGGGAPAPVVTREVTMIGSQDPPLRVDPFEFEPSAPDGGLSTVAGGHPWEITTRLQIPSRFSPASPQVLNEFRPIENLKSVSVELPPGLIGNPQATVRCTQVELRAKECPPASRVGTFAVIGDQFERGEFRYSGYHDGCCSAVYNVVPDAGFPAEFAFTFAEQVISMYASLVHGAAGEHVRITVSGAPAALETSYFAVTFFGDPARLNGGSGEAAFLSNPADCATKGLASRIELASWEDPANPRFAEALAYPELSGCGHLQFQPTLATGPSPAAEEGTSRADSPSAYSTELKVAQTEGFGEPATPPLRDASVVLPAGVSVSPSAAQGLVGCQATGPEGINIGGKSIGPGGRDEEDPEATELGAGHAGGNGSPFDDGFYHTAHGHCPRASTLGTVEVCTPLLPNRANQEGVKEESEKACEEHPGTAPLQGHLFLAQPGCAPCSDAQAENGELFGLYLEVEGSGVILKLPGTVAANSQTGQLTASFKESPQLPFSELKLHFHGGARAPLANPQTCGSFAATSTLTSWAAQEVSQPSEPFNVTGCPATMPFNPSFAAGDLTTAAGAFSPFTLTFSRHDGEQDLSAISETMPPGLLGKIAGIPLCDEAHANAGTCGPESEVGTTSVLAGSGEHPLYVPGGRVYLTTGYKGAPFGMSIVVPAVAGPFNLGNVVVRAAIHIDPKTAQVTVASDPLPEIKDGVPFRLRTVHVEINRTGGFTFNPTNCAQQPITATITAVQGATAAVASPFAVTGCQSLPFKPQLSAATAGNGNFHGASLDVKIAQKPGEAAIHKVDVQLPLALPTRLATLQKACTERQFAANPAGCPAGSVVGKATAITSILSSPLTGPAYLVSHGGAAFPDLDIVLQGEGVRIVLTGNTEIKKGITYSRFETVPDAPISSFELNLPEGPGAALAATNNLCALTRTVNTTKRVTRRVNGHLRRRSVKVKKSFAEPLLMPTTITGQNGTVETQTTKIAVTGCAKAKPTAKKTKARKTGTRKRR